VQQAQPHALSGPVHRDEAAQVFRASHIFAVHAQDHVASDHAGSGGRRATQYVAHQHARLVRGARRKFDAEPPALLGRTRLQQGLRR